MGEYCMQTELVTPDLQQRNFHYRMKCLPAPGSFYLALGIGMLLTLNRMKSSQENFILLNNKIGKKATASHAVARALNEEEIYDRFMIVLNTATTSAVNEFFNWFISCLGSPEFLKVVARGTRYMVTSSFEGKSWATERILDESLAFDYASEKVYMNTFCAEVGVVLFIVQATHDETFPEVKKSYPLVILQYDGGQEFSVLIHFDHTKISNDPDARVDMTKFPICYNQTELQPTSASVEAKPVTTQPPHLNEEPMLPIRSNTSPVEESKKEIGDSVIKLLQTMAFTIMNPSESKETLLSKMNNIKADHPELIKGNLVNLLKSLERPVDNCKHSATDNPKYKSQCGNDHCEKCLVTLLTDLRCPCKKKLSENNLQELIEKSGLIQEIIERLQPQSIVQPQPIVQPPWQLPTISLNQGGQFVPPQGGQFMPPQGGQCFPPRIIGEGDVSIVKMREVPTKNILCINCRNNPDQVMFSLNCSDYCFECARVYCLPTRQCIHCHRSYDDLEILALENP